MAVERLLQELDAEQRAAAVLPDGPAQVIAPAGSGKTTTLIARLGVLLERGTPAGQLLVLTFNRDAAAELSARIRARLAPLIPSAMDIEVRTLHALARLIVMDAGGKGTLIADRTPLLRAARRRVACDWPSDGPALPPLDALDRDLSAAKLEGLALPPSSNAVLEEYEGLLAARRALDFDDLLAEAVRALEARADLRIAWQSRYRHVLVDEFQDVDGMQLRLIALLAGPQRNLVVVGDDDQTIYAWRLADVRRILEFSNSYPGARRVMLATNYRCPRVVVEASARLIARNAERFAKPIRAAPGSPARAADLVSFPTAERDSAQRLADLAGRHATAGSRVCFLARTGSELNAVALALARAAIPHWIAAQTPLDAPVVVELIGELGRYPDSVPFPLAARLRAMRGWGRGAVDDELGGEEHAALDALLAWTIGFSTVRSFLAALESARSRIRELRRPDAAVQLMTVHAAKGLEFPVVVILGLEEDRFPNRRAVVDAGDAERAVEEERRLAYVALTRASRQLILAYDPARPSRFIAELGGRSPRARSPEPRRSRSAPSGSRARRSRARSPPPRGAACRAGRPGRTPCPSFACGRSRARHRPCGVTAA